MKFTAIDFETTGYENGAGNEPWQLGIAVVEDSQIVETAEFFFTARGAPAGRCGTSGGNLLDTWDRWYPYVGGRRLAAHNTATERTVLTRAAPLTRWGPWVDTLKLAKARYPRLKSYALSDLCAALGCVPELEGRTWHDALYDAVACARLALVLSIV